MKSSVRDHESRIQAFGFKSHHELKMNAVLYLEMTSAGQSFLHALASRNVLSVRAKDVGISCLSTA